MHGKECLSPAVRRLVAPDARMTCEVTPDARMTREARSVRAKRDDACVGRETMMRASFARNSRPRRAGGATVVVCFCSLARFRVWRPWQRRGTPRRGARVYAAGGADVAAGGAADVDDDDDDGDGTAGDGGAADACGAAGGAEAEAAGADADDVASVARKAWAL